MIVDRFTGAPGVPVNEVERRADSHPDKAFAIDEREILTYADLATRTYQVAHALVQAGVQKGDRVALCLEHTAAFFPIYFGAMLIGAIAVPCSTLYAMPELRQQLEHIRPRAIFANLERKQQLDAIFASIGPVGLVAYVGAPADGVVTFQEIVGHQPTSRPALPSPLATDPAVILSTSGTTARPKGVMLSHANLLAYAENLIYVQGWTEGDRALHHFPMFHANGGIGYPIPALLSGATLVLQSRFSASRFSQQLCESDITICGLNATHAKILLNTPPTPYDASHRVRYMRLGLTLEIELAAEFEKRFNTRLCRCYGLTEALGTFIAVRYGETVPPGSYGRVQRGYSVKVVGKGGRAVEPGVSGDVYVRRHDPNGLAMGYYNDAAETARAFQGNWLRTGDIGHFDADGYFWFDGRKKDMIKRSGFNVAPAELERVISSVPGVADVAVVGIPDHFREEAIVAIVVLHVGATIGEDKIVNACREELASYKVPQHVLFLDDLQHSFIGKVQRPKLRALAMQRLAAAAVVAA